MARTRGKGVVRRRPGRPRGAGAGAAAAAGRGRNAAPAAFRGGRPRPAPVAAPGRNVRPRRGVPDPPESSGSERGDQLMRQSRRQSRSLKRLREDVVRRRNRRDQEGASLVPFHFTPDAELSVKWGWVLTEEIQPIVDEISDEYIVKCDSPPFLYSMERGSCSTPGSVLVRDSFTLVAGLEAVPDPDSGLRTSSLN
ncbi:hypothetical protein R1sor_016545 [Riccia sorocarpa]|uniref:Uncharacterized protein n=1 Tax=Riccia sorocarpa TaxID=122646 RepID=A0ABD3HJF9_9MARC